MGVSVTTQQEFCSMYIVLNVKYNLHHINVLMKQDCVLWLCPRWLFNDYIVLYYTEDGSWYKVDISNQSASSCSLRGPWSRFSINGYCILLLLLRVQGQTGLRASEVRGQFAPEVYAGIQACHVTCPVSLVIWFVITLCELPYVFWLIADLHTLPGWY